MRCVSRNVSEEEHSTATTAPATLVRPSTLRIVLIPAFVFLAVDPEQTKFLERKTVLKEFFSICAALSLKNPLNRLSVTRGGDVQ